MQIVVTKYKAAETQLATSVRLFFENRDPVSTHTLAYAAISIIHEQMTEIDAINAYSALHFDNIIVKEDCKKEYNRIVKKFYNFFKHADRDKNKGIDFIEFNTDINEGLIFEGLNCLKYKYKREYENLREFSFFLQYFIMANPNFLKDEYKKEAQSIGKLNKEDLKAFFLEKLSIYEKVYTF